MNNQLLQLFINLVEFDQKICSVIAERQQLMSTSKEIDEQKLSLRNNLEQLKTKVFNVQKEVDEKELLMRELEQREATIKQHLNQISNIKEYDHLKSELSSINREQQDKEPELIDSWNELTLVKKKFSLEELSYQEKLTQLNQQQQEIKNKIDVCSIVIDDHEKQRAKLVKDVPEGLLSIYDNMRGQVDNPFVPVAYNSCSACFYPITAQDLAALKQGNLLPCKGCYRILYREDFQE